MSEGFDGTENGGGGGGGGVGKEQDRFLPIANIGRIMRRAVPENGKIAKDSKESVQECVSEFISFITSEASDKCLKEKRKTINGDDLIWSMGTLGFEDYVEPLKLYLRLYREGDTKGSRASELPVKKDVVLNGDPGSSLVNYGAQRADANANHLDLFFLLRKNPESTTANCMREDEAKPVTVKIIETVYVEADTADDFKSVVQRLTGKDAVAGDAPELNSAQRFGSGREASRHGDHKVRIYE
nr:putative transcription factor HAP3 [Oryza sativa Japonica Group]